MQNWRTSLLLVKCSNPLLGMGPDRKGSLLAGVLRGQCPSPIEHLQNHQHRQPCSSLMMMRLMSKSLLSSVVLLTSSAYWWSGLGLNLLQIPWIYKWFLLTRRSARPPAVTRMKLNSYLERRSIHIAWSFCMFLHRSVCSVDDNSSSTDWFFRLTVMSRALARSK